MSKSSQPTIRRISMDDVPACAGGGMSRRNFCLGAGAGLIAIGLPGCDPGGARITVGPVEGTDDLAQTNTGPSLDLAGPHDFATQPGTDGAVSPHDLAQNNAACPTGGVSAGQASAVAVGSALHLSGTGYSLFLCRDASGVYALDALCPHEGKLLTKQSTQFYCSRHGATFDLNGQHPTSPVFSPLDHYSVCVDGSGNIVIDPSTVVAATTRA